MTYNVFGGTLNHTLLLLLGWSKNFNFTQLFLHNANFIFPLTTNVSAKFYCDWSLFRGRSSWGCFIITRNLGEENINAFVCNKTCSKTKLG